MLASAILSVGQPIWEITVVQPLTLAKVKQDFQEHIKHEAEDEKRFDAHEKTLLEIQLKLNELVKLMERYHK
jgi:hypothetical protein